MTSAAVAPRPLLPLLLHPVLSPHQHVQAHAQPNVSQHALKPVALLPFPLPLRQSITRCLLQPYPSPRPVLDLVPLPVLHRVPPGAVSPEVLYSRMQSGHWLTRCLVLHQRHTDTGITTQLPNQIITIIITASTGNTVNQGHNIRIQTQDIRLIGNPLETGGIIRISTAIKESVNRGKLPTFSSLILEL